MRLALALGALALLACQPPPVKGTRRGELVVSVEGDMQTAALSVSFDVGAVQVGQTKTITVRATNVGLDAMKVVSVSAGAAGNGSWFVRDASGDLAPGASLTSTVTFAPAATGAQSTQVTFAHDADAAFPSLQLSGTGT
ncbi:MAG: hypothetical protein U0228_39520 [Myxococcaceae bacterium]